MRGRRCRMGWRTCGASWPRPARSAAHCWACSGRARPTWRARPLTRRPRGARPPPPDARSCRPPRSSRWLGALPVPGQLLRAPAPAGYRATKQASAQLKPGPAGCAAHTTMVYALVEKAHSAAPCRPTPPCTPGHGLSQNRGRRGTLGCRRAQAAEERGASLAAEAAVLGDELTRVGTVAARATTREMAGGCKDEGVVPVAMHMEEARAAPRATSPSNLLSSPSRFLTHEL